MAASLNRAVFFAAPRKAPFGRIRFQRQVDVMNGLLAA
ncbi:hypothetical protein MMMDOFMJ_4325 [Methylobacterium gnaphalii]|nr:hypothetical protein MMMDOFMJ_4325 [Methylobacterium gnaphalii]